MRPDRLLLLGAIVSLAACTAQLPVTEQDAPVVEERSQSLESERQTGEQKPATAKTYAYRTPSSSAGRSAVADLREKARLQTDQGKLNQAAALLERALRIQPRDALLWNQLADIRLRQKRYPQAESLARKSISLAGQQTRLKVRNWRMIATARQQSGNPEGAKRALRQAEQLSNQ